MTDGNAWDLLVQHLNKDNRYQFCLFDNRGMPRSCMPWGRYTTSEMAKVCRAISIR